MLAILDKIMIRSMTGAILDFVAHQRPQMRAKEFIVERKKRRRPRWAAYGPGPYGGYGYATGYSGDGGGDGGVGEADASDIELKQRYGDFDPEDKPMLPTTKVGGAPAPTLWTAYDAIENILGKNRVTDDEDGIEPGMYYVYASNEPPMFKDTEESGPGGSINIPNLESKAAKDVAMAVHEACHAYVHDKTKGSGRVHANEKIVNNLAEKWLRKHLSGTALHVAIETITGSRISYGKNYMPKSGIGEDQRSNEKPKGPETKPTMPKGTVKVDVSDVYDWYKLGQHISDLKGLGKHDFGKGPPSAILSFGDEDEEHKYIKNLKKTGLDTTDIDPKSHEKKKGQKTDPTYNVGENFADGKNPGRKGLAKRSGVNTKASVSSLRKTAKSSSGEKARMAHWLANMKAGRAKKNK